MDDEDDLISFGAGDGARDGVELHPAARLVGSHVVQLIAGLALAVAVVVAFVLHPADRRRADPAPPTPTPTPTQSIEVDEEYLVSVPAGDMYTAVHGPQCRVGCVARDLQGADLAATARSFTGLSPLAAGTVTTKDGHAVLLSVEAHATPDAIVHLIVQRSHTTEAPLQVVADGDVDGSKRLTISMTRDGWSLSAQVVVRDSIPPLDAAEVWCATTALPT